MIPLIKKNTRTKRSPIIENPESTINITHDEESVLFVPLGGLEEVGRNSMFFEYKDEIIIMDLGLQFPEDETPGIDYIIPNTTYLESKKQNIKAVILTHAHYDHIGALPYVMQKLGNPIIYTTALTRAIINKRQEEFPNAGKLNIEIIKNGDHVKLGKYFSAEFFHVAHNIPDTTGINLITPVGRMVHFADFKLESETGSRVKHLEELEKIGKQGVHTLLLDSTNAEEPGFSLPEQVVEKNLEEIFKKAEGRIIVGIFASLISRIDKIIQIAERMGRHVAVSGGSMRSNVQIAQNLGHIKMGKGTLIQLEDIHKYKDDKVLILSTGAQGEPNASLMKIVNGEHHYIQIKPHDTIIFSSSIVPGNERSVQTLKDNLARQGADVYYSKIVDVHSSGHAPQEELKMVMKALKPKYFIPVHGYFFMRATNARLAEESGIPRQNTLLLDNGQVVEMKPDKATITKDSVPASYVMVDGLGVGDVGEVVLRDRRVLAAEGMVVIIATLDRHTGRLIKNPNIISRGFIYLRENQGVIDEIREKLKSILARIPRQQHIDADYLKNLIRDQIGQFLFNKTKRRPMVLPVLIEV